MNGKKARKLRKICRQAKKYSELPKYEMKFTEKMVYLPNDKGELDAKVMKVPAGRVNWSKIEYRRLKKLLRGQRF